MNAKNIFYCIAVVACACSVVCSTCRAQSSSSENQQVPQQGEKTEHLRADDSTVQKDSTSVRQPEAPSKNKLGLALLKNLANDQKAIWTSPAHIRLGDATWLVPFAGLTA